MAQRNLILFLFATIPLISFNLQYYPLLLRCKKRVPVHPGSAKVGEGWAVCEDVHVDPAYCGINMNDLENIGREHQNNTFSPVKTDNVFKRVLIYGTVLFISLYFTLVTASHFQMLKSINNPVSPFCHPIKSTHYLTTHSLKGNIFNADRYGGYMLWHLYPSRKVYIDTRLSMRDRAFFSHYISLLDNPSRFPAIADSFTISAVVLPAFIPLYTKLIRYLYYNPDWKLVIADGSEALFVKQEQINTPGINIKDKKVLDSLNQNLQNNLGHNSLQIRFEAGYRLDSFIKNLE